MTSFYDSNNVKWLLDLKSWIKWSNGYSVIDYSTATQTSNPPPSVFATQIRNCLAGSNTYNYHVHDFSLLFRNMLNSCWATQCQEYSARRKQQTCQTEAKCNICRGSNSLTFFFFIFTQSPKTNRGSTRCFWADISDHLLGCCFIFDLIWSISHPYHRIYH